jgi:hypothetical protein
LTARRSRACIPTSASRSRPLAMSSPSCHPACPATVRNHQIRPGANCSAGLAKPQPWRVLRRQPRPVAHVMPGTRVMFVAMAAFPAAVSPDDLPAAERAGPLAGRCGDLAVCHLRDPLCCRLAVRGLRWMARVHRSDGGPGSGYSHSGSLRPRRRACATAVLSGGRPDTREFSRQTELSLRTGRPRRRRRRHEATQT